MLCAGVMGGLQYRRSSDREICGCGLGDWLKLSLGSNVGLFGCFKEVSTWRIGALVRR